MISYWFSLHPTPLPWTIRRPLAQWPAAFGGTPDALSVGDSVPTTAYSWRDVDGEWARWMRGKIEVCVPFDSLWEACRP